MSLFESGSVFCVFNILQAW